MSRQQRPGNSAVGAKKSKFETSRRRATIARQRPFDITMCTQDFFDAGDPIFLKKPTEATEPEKVYAQSNGTFSMGHAARHAELDCETLAIKPASAAASAAAPTFGEHAFVGFCVTCCEPRAPDVGYVPVTIAGAMTIKREVFFYLLHYRRKTPGVDDSLGPQSTGVSESTNEYDAGFKFVVGTKVIRLLESIRAVKVDQRKKHSGSVAVLLSTLS